MQFTFSYCPGPITNTVMQVHQGTLTEVAEFIKKNAGRIPYTFEELKKIANEEPDKFANIKAGLPYIIGGECTARNKGSLKSISLLPFDLDFLPFYITEEEISSRLEGQTHIIYKTISCNLFKVVDEYVWHPLPRFRVFIPMAIPVLPESFATLKKAHRHLGESIFPKEWIDASSYVLGQAMFLPVSFHLGGSCVVSVR